MHSIQNLVIVVDGEPLASTETIAKGMSQQHASAMKLLRRYKSRLERFGPIRFEIRLGKRGGKPAEYALLNEPQSAVLISLMKNSERVVDFKVDLVAEFYRMRDALNQRAQTCWKQMQALIAQEVESKVRASFGSRLMLERKREIPHFNAEHARLAAELQPSLPFH